MSSNSLRGWLWAVFRALVMLAVLFGAAGVGRWWSDRNSAADAGDLAADQEIPLGCAGGRLVYHTEGVAATRAAPEKRLPRPGGRTFAIALTCSWTAMPPCSAAACSTNPTYPPHHAVRPRCLRRPRRCVRVWPGSTGSSAPKRRHVEF